jgi:hypothetical protein
MPLTAAARNAMPVVSDAAVRRVFLRICRSSLFAFFALPVNSIEISDWFVKWFPGGDGRWQQGNRGTRENAFSVSGCQHPSGNPATHLSKPPPVETHITAAQFRAAVTVKGPTEENNCEEHPNHSRAGGDGRGRGFAAAGSGCWCPRSWGA